MTGWTAHILAPLQLQYLETARLLRLRANPRCTGCILLWSCTRRITHTPQRYRKLLISVQASGHAPLRTCCQLVERGWVISCGGDWGSRRAYAGFGDFEITVSGNRALHLQVILVGRAVEAVGTHDLRCHLAMCLVAGTVESPFSGWTYSNEDYRPECSVMAGERSTAPGVDQLYLRPSTLLSVFGINTSTGGPSLDMTVYKAMPARQ